MGSGRKLGGLLAAAILALGAGVWARPRLLPASGAVVGLRVDGHELRPGQDVREAVAARARELLSRELDVRIHDTTRKLSFAKLGLRVDVALVARRAGAIGRHGSLALRLDELVRARRGEIDVPLDLSLDPNVLAGVLLPLKKRSDQLAKPARYDFEHDKVLAHDPGRFLDLDASAEAVLRAARSGARGIELPFVEIAPEVSTALVRRAHLDTVVAQYETRFGRGGDADNRATNIETAAAKLDGVVLAPGGVVSFNRVVGARSRANGFRPGWEIYKGEMVRGVGGGTCQVSSTLHAAAFFAGLDVVERAPHSRPSAYIGLGLDSTVSWPTLDLKLRNPWSFPIFIHTEVQKNTLRVTLLGAKKPAEVLFARDTLAVIPFKRKVTTSAWLPEGTIVKKQKGIRGYRIRRTRRIVPITGAARVETTIDVYPATPEHYIVPPGTDLETALPPEPSSA